VSEFNSAVMRERSLPVVEPRAETAREPMDEDAFRAFYDRTARPLRAYLVRCTGDSQVADDLLQETYYRLLKASSAYTDEGHRRNALFRIASNLMADARRHDRRVRHTLFDEEVGAVSTTPSAGESADLERAMARLRPAQRKMVWLAYVQGASHAEIAETLGLRSASIRLLLFRARKQLASFLRGER